MDPSRNNHHDNHLGINKFSRQIRKSPPPPAFRPSAARPAVSQPQVYNISKNDFRDIVQQLTGTPTRDPIPTNPHPPPVRPQSQPSQRLQRIRPPPLQPLYQNPNPNPNMPPYQNPNPNPNIMPSPVTAYMRYLENSLLDTSRQNPNQNPSQQPGLLPSPVHPALGPQVPSPRIPLSPFLQSPTAFLNLLSPKSPYPLLSPPGFQYPPPLTPNMPLSPMPLSPGILGPAPGAPPGGPPSPGFFFPNSPSGLLSPNFFPIQSPRWRNG